MINSQGSELSPEVLDKGASPDSTDSKDLSDKGVSPDSIDSDTSEIKDVDKSDIVSSRFSVLNCVEILLGAPSIKKAIVDDGLGPLVEIPFDLTSCRLAELLPDISF
jgi:hypothetical protein